jgi:hypothetical protein
MANSKKDAAMIEAAELASDVAPRIDSSVIVAEPEGVDAKHEAQIEGFLNEFASNDTKRRQMRRAIDDGMDADEFAREFGSGGRHNDYVKGRYSKIKGGD